MIKVITEAQAQVIADVLQMFIAVEENKNAFAYTNEPKTCIDGSWIPSHEDAHDLDSWGCLPFRIESKKDWTEQIWTPTKTGDK